MRLRLLAAAAGTVLATGALCTPAGAVVGGKDTAAGAYPAVAYVTLGGVAACTGTLIAPDVVLTAGHCGSLTGSVIATPIGWPPGSIGVTLGADTPGGAGERVAVKAVTIPPSYLNTEGSDISLLRLTKAAAAAPVRVAGRGEEALWAPGVPEAIVGYGATKEGGSPATHLQEATVPVIADGTCAAAYPGAFDAKTQLCAGYPEGGIDTCQGDSGGPLFGHRPDGSLVLVGATSTGDGCARPGKPGIYARVADTGLREWIRSVAADAVDADVTAPAATGGGTPGVPPASTICTSKRKVTVTVKRAFRGRLRSVMVLVAGKRVATLRGGRTSTKLSFAGRRKGTVKVQLVMRLKSGKRVVDTRTFKVCGG